MEGQESNSAASLSTSYMNSSASHPLSPAEHEQDEAKDYFSSNSKAGRHGPSPSIDGLLSAEDHEREDEIEAPTPGKSNPRDIKASSRLPLFTPESQETGLPAGETILQLPQAPHLLKPQDLAQGLSAFVSKEGTASPTPTLPTDLVVAIISALSRELSHVQMQLEETEQLRIASVNGLSGVLQEYGLTAGSVERTLLRAKAEAQAVNANATLPRGTKGKWKLRLGDPDGVLREARRTSVDSNTGSSETAEQSAVKLIDVDLQEAMSDTQFDMMSDTASVSALSLASSANAAPAEDAETTVKRGRHSSLTARIFGGLSGSILSTSPGQSPAPKTPASKVGKSASPETVQEEGTAKAEPGHKARSHSVRSFDSGTSSTTSDSFASANKSGSGLSDWTGSVFGWRKQPKHKKMLEALAAPDSSTDDPTEPSESSTPMAQDAHFDWNPRRKEDSGSEGTRSDSSKSTATLNTTASSRRTTGTAPTAHSVRSEGESSSPPLTSTTLLPPASPKASVITSLISRRQLDAPTLSVPVTSFPALSNPVSRIASPVLDTASSTSSVKSGISRHHNTQNLDPAHAQNRSNRRPTHFTALALAASKWLTGDNRNNADRNNVLTNPKRVSANITNWTLDLVNDVASHHSSSFLSDEAQATFSVDRQSPNGLLRTLSLESSQSQHAQNSATKMPDAINTSSHQTPSSSFRSPSGSFDRRSPSLQKSGSRVTEPTVTLPTLGLTRQNSVFQAALSQPVASRPSAPTLQTIPQSSHPVASSSVELDTITSGEAKPPTFGATAQLQGMEQLVDRYGFMHEKNGMKVLRELRQRQLDKAGQDASKAGPEPAESTDSGPSSVKRLLAQLSDMNNTQEKVLQNAWDAYLKKRRAKHSAAEPAPSSRKERSLKNPAASLANQGSADLAEHDATHVAESGWSENLIGVAQMGTGGKAEREAWRDFKQLVRSGIPISLRPALWCELSGATDVREPGYYAELLQLHDEGGQSLCLKQINADVGRTFGSNVFFGGDGPGVAKLRRVLIAYSWHNPEVGYCQGMNLVAGTLLLTLPTEEDAFWVLCCIIERILPSEYYTSTLLVSRADQRVLKDLVAKLLPKMHNHFEDLGVELEAVTFGWFLSLFSLPLPIRTLLRVLDVFFCEGTIVLFRVTLAILKMNSDEIFGFDSASDLYVFLRGMTSGLHQADQLIKIACEDLKSSLKTKDVNSLRETHVAELSAMMS